MKPFCLFTLGFITSAFSWFKLTNVVHKYPVTNALFNHSVVEDKVNLLRNAPSAPRVLFVGGSNVLFGINAGQFGRETRLPAINFGCVAGMGPEMILHVLQNELQPGDLVVMAWEYGLYSFERSKNVNLTYMNLVYGQMSEFRKTLPKTDQFRLRLALPATSAYEGIAIYANPYFKPNKIKHHWQINEFGDLKSNIGNEITERHLREESDPGLLSPLEISSDFKSTIANFTFKCREKNVQLAATWPNSYKHPSYINNPITAKNYATIRQYWKQMGITVVGNPEDSLMEAKYIFNTPYHLNQEGTRIRTRKLVEGLYPLTMGIQVGNP